MPSRISRRSRWLRYSPNVVVVNPRCRRRTSRSWCSSSATIPASIRSPGPGVGSTPHLAGELFRLAFNLDLVHVPFTGAGPAIQSTLGGHTPIAFTALPPALAAVKDGKLRVLGVATAQRAASVPDVPTFAEQGITDQDADTLTGLVAPAGTPKEIVDLLQQEIAKIVAQPDVKERLARSASCRSPTRRRSSARASRPRSRSGARWCATRS